LATGATTKARFVVRDILVIIILLLVETLARFAIRGILVIIILLLVFLFTNAITLVTRAGINIDEFTNGLVKHLKRLLHSTRGEAKANSSTVEHVVRT
jgi:hypothetical protein